MCYPLPGPRCSPHALARLEKLQERYEENHNAMVDIARKRSAVRIQLNANPESEKLKKSYASMTKRGAAYKNKEAELGKKVRLAQIEYDGTSKGQAELQAILSDMKKNGSSTDDQMKINRRISKGKSKNFTRKFQYELAQTQKRTGQTTKQRRGRFLSLDDRDGTEEVTLDNDLLTTS